LVFGWPFIGTLSSKVEDLRAVSALLKLKGMNHLLKRKGKLMSHLVPSLKQRSSLFRADIPLREFGICSGLSRIQKGIDIQLFIGSLK
jgi:hypothetical protein